MAKISKGTQDNLDIFQGALEKGLLDWATFFHLEQDQRASAEQLLSKQGYLSWTPGSYEVSPGIRGIVPASRAPACFKDKASANTLVDFYRQNNIQASIKQID